MPDVRKAGQGTHGYGVPVALIAVLIFGYWIISEWNALPRLISSAIATLL